MPTSDATSSVRVRGIHDARPGAFDAQVSTGGVEERGAKTEEQEEHDPVAP